METPAPVQFIQDVQVAAILKDPSAVKPAFIDVRDAGFEKGHVKGAKNIPEGGNTFKSDEELDELVAKFMDEEKVIFYCNRCKNRGPNCARRFAERLEVVAQGSGRKPEVLVLQDGFTNFGAKYEGDLDLIEA